MADAADGRHQAVVNDLTPAGFAVDVARDPILWLATYAVFIAGVVVANIAAAGCQQPGNKRPQTTRLVLAVRGGFAGLTRQGGR